MIRKKKLFVRPRKLYIKSRIKEENALVEKYGLKSKREIWKAIARINYYRSRAKDLARAPIEEQKVLFDKLNYLGLSVQTLAEVLALQVEQFLQRRLPSVIFKKGLAKTPQEARQMVTHKRISIDGKIINIPGYLVPVHLEPLIKLNTKPNKTVSNKEESA